MVTHATRAPNAPVPGSASPTAPRRRRAGRAVLAATLTGLLVATGATGALAAAPNPVTVKPIASSDGNAGTTGTIKWNNPGKYTPSGWSISDFAPDGHGPELFIESHKLFDNNLTWHIDYYYHYTDGSGRTKFISPYVYDTGYSNSEYAGDAIDYIRVKICNGGSKAGGGDHCSAYHKYANAYSPYKPIN